MPHAVVRCPSHAASAHEFCEDFFVMCRKIALNLHRGMKLLRRRLLQQVRTDAL
jgi:hypothetical protein